MVEAILTVQKCKLHVCLNQQIVQNNGRQEIGVREIAKIRLLKMRISGLNICISEIIFCG